MSEVLRKAAVDLYGQYNNGNGVKRPKTAHEALKGINRNKYDVAIEGIAKAISDAHAASEDLEGYAALRVVSEAARSAVAASGFSDRQIADIALSEVSAEWIIEAAPGADEITQVAGLVVKSRPVAREFLKLFWWDDALDID